VTKQKNNKVKVIPLGGLGEVGKNMTVIETEEDIVVIDCGVAFPDFDMLGIDMVIPDISYLVKNVEKIRGVILTHGHEDHTGSLPFFLQKINVPVYGTRLTIALVNKKLEEYGMQKKARLQVVNYGDKLKLGSMRIEFIRTITVSRIPQP